MYSQLFELQAHKMDLLGATSPISSTAAVHPHHRCVRLIQSLASTLGQSPEHFLSGDAMRRFGLGIGNSSPRCHTLIPSAMQRGMRRAEAKLLQAPSGPIWVRLTWWPPNTSHPL